MKILSKRQWIQRLLAGENNLPIPQHWMSFFNGRTARRLTPNSLHYNPLWLYDSEKNFDFSPIGPENLDRMIAFNNYTGRCFACLGKGANIAFGHGGPGEFFNRILEKSDDQIISEYETTVKVKVQFNPYFYHSYDHPVRTAEDLQKLPLPDAADPGRYAGFAQDAGYLKSRGEYVIGSMNGFFSGIHYFFMDFQQTLMDLILTPELIDAILARLGPWNLMAARKMMEAGADGVALCDDLGSRENLLMSPDQYRKFFKPWHKRLCDEVHDRGGTVHLHSHGAIGPILDDLAECGFDFINPFDPEEGHDLEAILRDYSKHFIAVGGFPTSFWQWPAKKQKDHLEKTAALAETYARLIFMDSGGVPETITSDDFARICQESRRVRKVEGIAELA